MTNTIKYYLYTAFKNTRFSRITSVLFVVQILKLNLVQFSLLESIYMFAQFFSEIPSGILGDMFQNKKVVLSGLLFSVLTPLITISTLFLPRSLVFPVLVLSFGLEGVANALTSGADDALFYEGIRNDGAENSYGKIRGNMQLISSIILGLATAVGGYLFTLNVKMPYLFQSVFLLGAISIIAVTKEQKKIATSKNEEKESYSSMLKSILSVFKDMVHSPNILFLFIFMIIITAVVNAIFMLLPNYLSQLGFDASANGSVFMLFSFAGGLVATQAYRLIKLKFSTLTILIASILLASTGLQLQSNRYLFLLGAGLLYITLDILDPVVMQMLNLWVGDQSRATFISGLSFATSLVTMIINPIIGAIVQSYGTIIMLTSTTVVTVVLIGIAYVLILRTKGDSSHE